MAAILWHLFCGCIQICRHSKPAAPTFRSFQHHYTHRTPKQSAVFFLMWPSGLKPKVSMSVEWDLKGAQPFDCVLAARMLEIRILTLLGRWDSMWRFPQCREAIKGGALSMNRYVRCLFPLVFPSNHQNLSSGKDHQWHTTVYNNSHMVS
jgi:hypothetical protein